MSAAPSAAHPILGAPAQVHAAVGEELHPILLELMSLVGRASGALRGEPAIFQHDAMREVGDIPGTHSEHVGSIAELGGAAKMSLLFA